MLLAFDTATAAVTAALHDGNAVVASCSQVDPLRHGELLAPAIAHVLDDAGITVTHLTGLAVGVGPGPFTGLRVGIVTARTISAALRIPLVGVSSLDILAAAVTVRGQFLVATDARRKEVYWARYADPRTPLSEPAVDYPDSLPVAPTAGRGPRLYPETFTDPIDPEYPDAADLARLVAGGAAKLRSPVPLYLRRPDVSPATPRRRLQ